METDSTALSFQQRPSDQAHIREGAVAELGLTGDYDRQRFDDEEPRDYDPAAVESFLAALVRADAILKRHRETLVGEGAGVLLRQPLAVRRRLAGR